MKRYLHFSFKRSRQFFDPKKQYWDIEIHIFDLFYFSAGYGIFWFKFFRRWGVWAKNIEKNSLLFSQRNKYVQFKYYKLGNWIFEFFKRP